MPLDGYGLDWKRCHGRNDQRMQDQFIDRARFHVTGFVDRSTSWSIICLLGKPGLESIMVANSIRAMYPGDCDLFIVAAVFIQGQNDRDHSGNRWRSFSFLPFQ